MLPKLFLCLLCAGVITGHAQSNITLTKSVSANTDDAEEYISGTAGSMSLNSSDLELMTDGSQTQKIGIRFNTLSLPQGAVIQHAFIQFATKGDKNAVSGTIVIKGQATDNAATFTTTTNNLSNRTPTSDSVSWAGSTSSTWGTTSGGVQGAEQRTPELKTIVQAIVNRPGWASGNALAFLFTGTGVRNAYAYDGSPALAPQLIVQYTLNTPPPAIAIDTLPIMKGSKWAYNDSGISLDGSSWTTTNYNDTFWSQGPGKLGYSDNALTILNYGPSASNKYITYYFRKKFNVPSVAALSDTLLLNLLRDDGAIVYINGQEVLRSNMAAGAFDYQTFSSAIVDGVDESTYFPYHVPKNLLVDGINTIAVEVHQRDGTSSDLGFDMDLSIMPKPSLIRGPYLQVATTNSIHLRWRTDQATSSRVHYGTSSNSLTGTVTDSTLTMEHELVLNGLAPHTKYWYSIGSITDTLQGDTSNYFMTLRPAGDTALLRIGVIGDCGNNSTNQINVRDQVAAYLGGNYMDSWILLGDNAYTTGTDAEFQVEFFNIYKNRFLKQNPLFPAPGNHDYGNSTSSPSVVNHSVAPYYKSFSMPSNGEAGGVPSGKQSYYSFDVGNVHFLSLDSYGKEDSATLMYDTTGAQVQWIKADLAANTNKGWVVAYWHHPPYTMGSHNSDSEGDLVNIRQNFIRILERMGVDMILCGHSHDYERSKLMQGHYGSEATFNPSVHNISQSSGLYDGSANSCPYIKDSVTQPTGTVYVVSGSAGQLGGTQASFPHAALSAYADATHGGAMMLEVQGNRLDAKWVCADGTIRDHFTMMKDVNVHKTYTINAGDSVTLTARFNGTYSWNNGAYVTKSIRVAPTDTMTYIVQDNNNCVADTFKVNVQQGTPLPVQLTAFAATATANCTATIQWTTATEEAGAKFIIERATEANVFIPVGTVLPQSSLSGNQYSFIDNTPTEGMNYYRLNILSSDRSSVYSSIKMVKMACAPLSVTMSPNPVNNSLLIAGLPKTRTNIVIYNSNGQIIKEQSCTQSSIHIDFSRFAQGIYAVQVTDEQGKVIAAQSISKQ
ncbi:metallophosphoesterase [Taibaiella sp. KBW10]|uniref:metallophosphoesterase n=1 Tax=Taibaiella sp. KBW10 TaxID=2153357 RepID=UPI000F5A3785|nr:metallophosphoesterase [Taibaiella sp. KBW10]